MYHKDCAYLELTTADTILLEDTLGSISYDDYRDMLFNWFYYHDMTHRREPVLWGKRLSTSIIDKIIAVC